MSLKAWWRGHSVSDEQILSAIGAWMLCCAVGAQNKTLSASGNLDFDMWFSTCKTTWVPQVEMRLGISAARIERVLRSYARRNELRTYMAVFESENTLHPEHKKLRTETEPQ